MPANFYHLFPSALAEPNGTALLLLVLGVLMAFSALSSRTADRLGMPVVLLFLVLGMLGGSQGFGGIAFNNYELAARAGTTALALILFDGGLSTSASSVRRIVLPAAVLATAGVAMTAVLVALFARLLGLNRPAAMLCGAVVSSTDAAAVFAVLRGGRLQLKPRLARLLEIESCVNDPMAVILTLALIEALAGGAFKGEDLWGIALSVPVQLVIGLIVGLLIGWMGRMLLGKARITTTGLYPALTLAIAFLAFGASTVLYGSGFLAVFVAGMVLGNGTLPYRSGLMRVHEALAWLSQIVMFLMLGLLVTPSELPAVAWIGLSIGLFLAVIARPVAVTLCLLPFRVPPIQTAYIGWVGLRGAVPIILAIFPVLAGVPGAHRVFNIIFFVVVVSCIVPGSTIRWITRRLKLNTPDKPDSPAVLEINSTHALSGELTSFFIEPDLIVSGALLSEITFPAGASVVLIVRGRDLIAARGGTRIQPGDHVYVFFRPADRPFMELLFGGPEKT
jgi:cell volume regulation protein A